jgi:flagellar FliL protein
VAEQEQEGVEIKSSKKKIIIIVAVVVLLIVGAGVTFFLMKGDSSHGEKAEHVEEEESTAMVEKLYFDMSKPLIVGFPQGSAFQNGRITMSILVEGAEALGVVKKNEPMIRNNLLMLIGAQDSGALNTSEGKDLLRKSMLDTVTEVLKKMAGKGLVKEVFFTSFVMQ